ncbi:MAG: hypothetical protein ACOCV2_15045 [Persicimonas sp.]
MSDQQLLSYFKQHDDPVYSVVELAPEFEIGEEGVRVRLNSLVEVGKLETKKPGSSTRVYWLPRDDDSA